MLTNQDEQVPILTRLKRFWDSIGIYTKLIFIFCIAIYIVELFYFYELIFYFSFRASLIVKLEIWRIWTGAFLHGGILHIIFNMISLLTMGSMLEMRMGTTSYFIATWILNTLSSVIHVLILFFSLYFTDYLLPSYEGPAVGYSAVLFGCLVLSIRYFPEARNFCGFTIAPHFLPWIMLIICQFIMMNNVSFLGHLSGIISGYIYFFILKIPQYRIILKTIDGFVSRILSYFNSFFPFDSQGIDSVDSSNRFQNLNIPSIFSMTRNFFNRNVINRFQRSASQQTSSGHVELVNENDDENKDEPKDDSLFPGKGRRLGGE